MRFQIGDRIRISPDYYWAKGATGHIAEPPEFVRELVRHNQPWDRWRRIVQTVDGPIEFYWVVFDQPHDDGSGDGPYEGGEIEADMIEHV
jgi:hypothetical protein